MKALPKFPTCCFLYYTVCWPKSISICFCLALKLVVRFIPFVLRCILRTLTGSSHCPWTQNATLWRKICLKSPRLQAPKPESTPPTGGKCLFKTEVSAAWLDELSKCQTTVCEMPGSAGWSRAPCETSASLCRTANCQPTACWTSVQRRANKGVLFSGRPGGLAAIYWSAVGPISLWLMALRNSHQGAHWSLIAAGQWACCHRVRGWTSAGTSANSWLLRFGEPPGDLRLTPPHPPLSPPVDLWGGLGGISK